MFLFKQKKQFITPFEVVWVSVENVPFNTGNTAHQKVLSKALEKKQKKMLNPSTKISLQNVLRTDWNGIAKQVSSRSWENYELSDVDVASHGVQLNLEKAFRDDLELPLIWKRIRLHLSYRPEHALADISGVVQLRLRIDRDGKLLRIFEESSVGRKELLGWTLLCLLDTFREPFLKEPMKSPRTLDLRIQYTMGEKVLASEQKSARMRFVVEGDMYTESDREERDPPIKGHLNPLDRPIENEVKVKFFAISNKKIMEFFKDKTLRNHGAWDYYTKRDYYREQCHRHKNQVACEKLLELTSYVQPPKSTESF